MTATVAAGVNPNDIAVNPVTNKIYVANEGNIQASNGSVTVIDGASNSTATVAANTSPYALTVNPATNKVYVANDDSDSVTVIDATNNSTTTVAAGRFPQAVTVNPITNKVYVANIGTDSTANTANVTVITPAPTSVIPLNTAVAPLVNNTTPGFAPTFTLTATSTYAPNAPKPQNIYYQIDSTYGVWTKAVNTGSTATTLTASAYAGVLKDGIHIIYFFATDGSDATSINPSRSIRNGSDRKLGNLKQNDLAGNFETFAPESSPVIGGINAYPFLVRAAPTSASVSIGGRVATASGSGIPRALVSITDAGGNVRTVMTNPFGFYRLMDVAVGETYIFEVRSKSYQFADSPKVLFISEEDGELNFTAVP